MNISPLVKYKFRNAIVPLLLTGMATGVFICALSSNWHYLNFTFSFLVGATVFIILFSFSDYILKKLSKRLNLLFSLLIQTSFYLAVIVIVIVFYLFLFSLPDINSFVNVFKQLIVSRFLLYGLLFGIFISLVLNFLFSINTLIGNGILGNLLIGRYQRPKSEERFFLFLDLKSSTKIAEEMGADKYLHFLNEFYYDVSEPVVLSKGFIYKYVGDEIIVTWKKKHAQNNKLITGFFNAVTRIIEKKENVYQQRYKQKPFFRASLHFGEVVTGELGYLKNGFCLYLCW
jgi:adenylate cyclase